MARSDVKPGSTVGTYTVQGRLGATAWSDTFVAAGPGDRLVALKIIDESDAAAWDSMEQTRKLLESVPEHLVLPLIDSGSDAESGVRFVATPLSDHPSLADLVEIYALTPPEATALVKNLAIAIDGAHAAGLAHLALKPSNVFVGPPPTYAVRIVDFGADALRRAKKERGALSWLAPEQIDEEDAADARADVFVAALLAFFAMTGKPYWAARAADDEALLEEIRAPRVAPSLRARAVGTPLPTRLDAVLLRALAPLEERFDSARAFADALEDAVAEPPPAVEEQRSSERHVKATLRLEKFRMPTLENSAPSGMQPLPQRTMKLPPANVPDAPFWTADPTPSPDEPLPIAERPREPTPPAPPAADAARIATPIEPVAMQPRRSIYIPQRLLVVLVVAVTALVIGVTVAAISKMRSEQPLPAPSVAPASSSMATPQPPTSIVVPPPPAPEDTAPPPDTLAANESEIEVVCTPACDKVLIDGRFMTTYPAPMRVAPGRHGIGVSRTGSGGQFRSVVLKGGERQSVAFTFGGPSQPRR